MMWYCSIPSKIFLLGEYAVLNGLPACVACLPHRFILRATPVSSSSFSNSVVVNGIDPLSKLTIWARESGYPEYKFQFEDPYFGEGGFGASTAEFAMSYQAYVQGKVEESHWISAWSLYRKLVQDGQPSGADLIAQWQGGVSFIQLGISCENVAPLFDLSRFLVFATGRKVKTHEHLRDFKREILNDSFFLLRMKENLELGLKMLRENNLTSFGSVMRNVAEHLFEVGLETPETHQDRLELSLLPGVLGVKGCGALQSDAILILIESHQYKDSVIQAAKKRGLRLVADQLSDQIGVTCQFLQ